MRPLESPPANFGNKAQRYLAHGPAKPHPSCAYRTDFLNFENLSWNCETHNSFPASTTTRAHAAISDHLHISL
jgi:hypothetical protein